MATRADQAHESLQAEGLGMACRCNFLIFPSNVTLYMPLAAVQEKFTLISVLAMHIIIL